MYLGLGPTRAGSHTDAIRRVRAVVDLKHSYNRFMMGLIAAKRRMAKGEAEWSNEPANSMTYLRSISNSVEV